MSLPLRIEEMWAFIGEDTATNEGLCGFSTPGGIMMPMVAADPARVDSLRAIAQSLSDMTGKRIRLVKFSQRSVIEVIQPRTAAPSSTPPGRKN